MPRGDRRAPRARRRASRGWWLAETLVVLTVALSFVAEQFDLGVRVGLAAGPDREPAQVAPPLSLPALKPAGPVARPQTGARPDPATVRAAVSRLLADPRLGRHVRLLVTDLTSGRVVLDQGTGTATPASTMKLSTSVAALQSMGPARRFTTRVVRGPGHRVVLVGGGDPFLAGSPAPRGTYPARADLVTLARRTAKTLRAQGITRVRLGYDDSLFGGPGLNPRWPASYAGVVAPPITALLVDEGRDPDGYGYSRDPSRTGAQSFAAALRRTGITVKGAPVPRTAPSGATTLGAVESAPLGQIVARLLLVSDNNAAEVVAHHVGIAEGTGGSFAGGAAGVRAVLGRLGVPLAGARIYDGSGLSRQDRLDPATTMGVVRVAASAARPRLNDALTGLPVAGFSGSLANRFDESAPVARGRVRAKTGTLSGVHGLAGVATDLDGDVLGFVVVADRVAETNDAYAQDQLDKVAAALAACSCRASGG